MKRASAFGLILVTAVVASADEVMLRGGGKVTGVIVERTADAIVLETAPGRVTVPLARVLSVRETRSALSVYQEKAGELKSGDWEGWLDLARWAADRDLATQAREAYRQVLAFDPGNSEANAFLGRVRHDGRWMSEEDANRARGLVPFDGGWVTPGEREAILRDQGAADRAARESEARVREAEARAREAEARAQAAQTAGQDASTGGYDGGVPYWPYVYGGGGGFVTNPGRPGHRPGHHPGPRPSPPPVTLLPPVPPPPTSSVGTTSRPPAKAPTQGARVADPRKKQ